MKEKKRYVGAPVIKKDAMALVTGKPVYTQDIAPKDCLVVKVLRSPHAHALIQEMDISQALAVDGIVAVLNWMMRPGGGLPWPVRPIRSQAPMTV